MNTAIKPLSSRQVTPMHSLDNVIWQALTTRQSHFAKRYATARRFPQEVSPLCGFERPDHEGYASLSGLVSPASTVGIFLNDPYEPRSGWEYVVGAALQQMVSENGSLSLNSDDNQSKILELGTPDSPEMLELTALTKPGPFGTRTHELGYYVGIRDNGKLVAMAGERLKVPGYTEISAVCTHPDHLGKGYARVLMNEVMRTIRERGEKPFLHVRSDNSRAIALYERLGFYTRWKGYFAVLRKTEP
jgi:ribosomal protein S18 acetylase RimI-like enzyme